MIHEHDDPLANIQEQCEHVLEYVVVCKVLDAEGQVSLLTAKTPSLAMWEALGMLDTATATLRSVMMSAMWTRAAEEDEEDL